MSGNSLPIAAGKLRRIADYKTLDEGLPLSAERPEVRLSLSPHLSRNHHTSSRIITEPSVCLRRRVKRLRFENSLCNSSTAPRSHNTVVRHFLHRARCENLSRAADLRTAALCFQMPNAWYVTQWSYYTQTDVHSRMHASARECTHVGMRDEWNFTTNRSTTTRLSPGSHSPRYLRFRIPPAAAAGAPWIRPEREMNVHTTMRRRRRQRN